MIRYYFVCILNMNVFTINLKNVRTEQVNKRFKIIIQNWKEKRIIKINASLFFHFLHSACPIYQLLHEIGILHDI